MRAQPEFLRSRSVGGRGSAPRCQTHIGGAAILAGDVIGAPRGGAGRWSASDTKWRASPMAKAQSRTMEVRIVAYLVEVERSRSSSVVGGSVSSIIVLMLLQFSIANYLP